MHYSLYRTHSVLVAPVCGLLHLRIELVLLDTAFIFRECIHLLVVTLSIVPLFLVYLSTELQKLTKRRHGLCVMEYG